MGNKSFRLSLARETVIASLAERIANERFPAGRVEPEQIAAQENIAFCYASFPEDFDGTLIHRAGRFFIVCNDHLHPRGSARSRFTFSHELGHYYLHRDALAADAWPAHYSRAEFASDQPLEMEADCFAANLLLPEKAVRRTAAKIAGSGFDRIDALATVFGASFTATAYRALALNFFPAPAAIFHWDAAGALVGRRMSDATAMLRREYCALTDAPPPESRTACAIAEPGPGTARSHSHAMNWFPKLTGYDRGDEIMLHEEVKSLGHYGFITLIHADPPASQE